MSRSFHSFHVFVGRDHRADEARQAVCTGIQAHLESAGLEPVRRARDADRIVRISGTQNGWISIQDDDPQCDELFHEIARQTRLPALLADCEASTYVSLELFHAGATVGGWAPKQSPPDDLVAPLLSRGDPEALAAAWDHGRQQTFPETAIAQAARRFGLSVGRVFEDATVRGTTLRYRQQSPAWTPQPGAGAATFEVTPDGTNWRGSRLYFVNRPLDLSCSVRSRGSAGRGLTLSLGGSAVEQGLIQVDRVTLNRPGSDEELSRPIIDHQATFEDLTIPAGYSTLPDTFELSERQRRQVDQLERDTSFVIQLHGVAAREGDGSLRYGVHSASGEPAEADLSLVVMFDPYRPLHARSDVSDHTLFSMHIMDQTFANLTTAAPTLEAWQWFRGAVQRWSPGGELARIRVTIDGDASVVEVGNGLEQAWNAVAERIAAHPDAWLEVAGRWFRFGHIGFRPISGYDPPQTPILSLLLAAETRDVEPGGLQQLRRIIDEGMVALRGVSGLMAQWEYAPDERTTWEETVGVGYDPLPFLSWHEKHLRGVDFDGVWLGPSHLSAVDLSALPSWVKVKRLGDSVRLHAPPSADLRRADLAAMEAVLEPILPSEHASDTWTETYLKEWVAE